MKVNLKDNIWIEGFNSPINLLNHHSENYSELNTDNCLYIDNRLNLCCRFLIIGAKVYIDSTRYFDKIRFRYNKDNNDYEASIFKRDFKPVLLSEYDVDGNVLIKKDYVKKEI